jgi:hypothetical protein
MCIFFHIYQKIKTKRLKIFYFFIFHYKMESKSAGIVVAVILIVVIIILLIAYSYCPSSESSGCNSPCPDVKSAQCAASKKSKNCGHQSDSPDCESEEIWKRWKHTGKDSDESRDR